jgi:Chaperone for flagella basal body P-ring formation
MIGTSRILIGALLLLAAAPYLCARIDSREGANRVVDALHAVGIEATSNEVEFLTSVPASSTRTDLRVTDWRRLDQSTIWVRLVCRRPQDCLPFFILLHPDELQSIPLFHPSARAMAPVVARKKAHPSVLVRAGSRVTMILQSGAARITAPGVCLDDGNLGSRVRVTNVATRQILTAEIVDRGLVQAHF